MPQDARAQAARKRKATKKLERRKAASETILVSIPVKKAKAKA